MAKKNNFFKSNKREDNKNVKDVRDFNQTSNKEAAKDDMQNKEQDNKQEHKRGLDDIKNELKEVQGKLKVIIDSNKEKKKANNMDEEYLELKIIETNLKLEQEAIRHQNFVNRNKKAIKRFEKYKKEITFKKIAEIQKEKNISSEQIVRVIEKI